MYYINQNDKIWILNIIFIYLFKEFESDVVIKLILDIIFIRILLEFYYFYNQNILFTLSEKIKSG